MSESLSWRYLPLGEGALLLDASPPIPLANRYVVAVANLLESASPLGFIATVPAISSLLVIFDPLQITMAELSEHLWRLLDTAEPAPTTPARIVTVPVRYGGEDGPDLEEVAARLTLHPEQVVALHCAQIYRVMMVGFAPGFPYIGLLPKALDLPRRNTPRTAVSAGSVAIAAGLTGIYPARLPGGWHLIGRTEICLFDPTADPPALLMAGDGVRFEPLEGGVVP